MIKEITAQDLLRQIEQLTAQAKGGIGAQSPAQPVGEFSRLLQQSIGEVNAAQQQAADLATAFELGNSNVSLEQVIIAREKAALSFQSVLQVRNKLVEAYKEVMAMQV